MQQYYCPDGILQECPIGYKCPYTGMTLPIKCTRNLSQNTTCYQAGLTEELPCPNGTVSHLITFNGVFFFLIL